MKPLPCLFALSMAGLLPLATAIAQDWSACANDLDELRRRARDASSAAEDADAKKREFDSAEEELQRCRRSPQIYDSTRDGCQYRRSNVESARASYRSSLESLKSNLDDVDLKNRSASSSCGYEISSVTGPAATVPSGVKRPDQCAIYLKYKGRLPRQTLLETCAKQMPAEDCAKCLQ